MSDPCIWTYDHDYDESAWTTTCGQSFILIEGTPTENHMRFCCYCGEPLTEASPDRQEAAA